MKQRLPQLLIAFAVFSFQMEAAADDISCADIRFTPEAKAVYDEIGRACLDVTQWQGIPYVRLKAMVVAQSRWGTHLRFDHGKWRRGEPYRASFPEDFQVLLNGQVVGLDSLGIRQDIHILVPDSYWEAPEPEPAAGEAEDATVDPDRS